MPEGSEDGYYNITLTADGQILGVTFEPESAHPIAERRDVEPLAARQLPINGYRCLDQPRLNAGYWNRAWGDFTSWCDRGAAASGFSAIARVVVEDVAWMCNKANTLNRCYRGEYDQFVDFISIQCSGLSPGFADVDPFFKSYGRQKVNTPFCR